MPKMQIKDEKINALKKKMTDGKASIMDVQRFLNVLDFVLVFKSQDDIEKDFKNLGSACTVTDAIVATIPATIKEIDENLAILNAELNSNAAELAAEEQKLQTVSKAPKATNLSEIVGQTMTSQMANQSIKTLNKVKESVDDYIKKLIMVRKNYLELLHLKTTDIRARLTEFKTKTTAPSDKKLGEYIKDLIVAFNQQYKQCETSFSKMSDFGINLEQALNSKDKDSKLEHTSLDKNYNDLVKDRDKLTAAYPKLKADYDILIKNIDIELPLLRKVIESFGNSKGEQQAKMVKMAKDVMQVHQEIKEKFDLVMKTLHKTITLDYKLVLEKLKTKPPAAALAASLSKVTGGAQQAAGVAAASNAVSANPNANQVQFKPA